MSDGYELVIRRNRLYKASYRHSVSIFLLLVIVSFSLVGFVYYYSLTNPTPKYFPTTPDGKLIAMPPLYEDHLKLSKLKVTKNGFVEGLQTIKYEDLKLRGEDALLLDWVEQTIQKIWNIDFVNYRSQIQGFRKHFSSKGYSLYLQAFMDSNNIETIKRGKVAHAELQGPAELIRTSMYQGRMVWYVNVPINVVYEGIGEETLIQPFLAKLILVRVSTLQVPVYGVAIARVIYIVRDDEIFEDIEFEPL